jgi:transcriptional regulator with XRE-family HTH domain
MGQAGKALRQVLETYSISQSSLATALGVDRPVVFRWFHEQTDPTAETVASIVRVLREINPIAAREFIRCYLVDPTQDAKMDLVATPSQDLPTSVTVDVSALSRFFKKTTNSYKYLFFISILDILERRQFDAISPISFREIIVEMLANAWYSHTYFKLSFGLQDKISNKLDSLNIDISDTKIIFQDTQKRHLRRTISDKPIDDIVLELRRYVPFLLIRPFFEQELKSANTGRNRRTNPGDDEQKIINLAETLFDVKKPLYRFDASLYKDCSAINFHPEWIYYIENNYSIVRAWASWEWLKYMQQRNPNVPAVANKLFPPQERGKIEILNSRKYWQLILGKTQIRCIYSNQCISLYKFDLDHYLPWSFVAHNQPWNLIPIVPEVNSSKSNHIPADKYFNEFVYLQHLGLSISRDIMGNQQWSDCIEPYLLDLKIANENNLIDLQILKSAYQSTLTPLISIAIRQGFTTWSYR